MSLYVGTIRHCRFSLHACQESGAEMEGCNRDPCAVDSCCLIKPPDLHASSRGDNSYTEVSESRRNRGWRIIPKKSFYSHYPYAAILLHRRPLLQFFEPVQDDVDSPRASTGRCGSPGFLHHQEPAVAADIPCGKIDI